MKVGRISLVACGFHCIQKERTLLGLNHGKVRNARNFEANDLKYMLTAVDMAEYDFPGMLSENTGSASAINFLVHKYKECLEEHTECNLQQPSPIVYPSRLLDVGSLGDVYVSLRHTRNFVNAGPYFCLSHCKYHFGLGRDYNSTLAELFA
jgi:hypothetical protein